jgi:hypothetical protein
MMLSKELLDLFKRQSLDMYVDSVGVRVGFEVYLMNQHDSLKLLLALSMSSLQQDDVYTWNVELASFSPDSQLQQVNKFHRQCVPVFLLYVTDAFFFHKTLLVRTQIPWKIFSTICECLKMSIFLEDMQEMQRKYAVSFVKLIINFKRGLHPFYPPSIEVCAFRNVLYPEGALCLKGFILVFCTF